MDLWRDLLQPSQYCACVSWGAQDDTSWSTERGTRVLIHGRHKDVFFFRCGESKKKILFQAFKKSVSLQLPSTLSLVPLSSALWGEKTG